MHNGRGCYAGWNQVLEQSPRALERVKGAVGMIGYASGLAARTHWSRDGEGLGERGGCDRESNDGFSEHIDREASAGVWEERWDVR